MSDNPRDTQFQDFAKLLWGEIYTTIFSFDRKSTSIVGYGCAMCSFTEEELIEILGPIIAHRAYDLMAHILKNADPIDLDTSGEYLPPNDEDVARRIANMPDMTAFPDSNE